MPSNQILNTLMRLQPGARRVDLPEDELGFDEGTTAFSPGSPGGQDPSVELFGLQGDRQRELKTRMAQEVATPNRAMPGNFDRLKLLLGGVEDDMAPMQGDIDANRMAQRSGFGSSAEAGDYGRAAEMAKISSPLDVAGINQRGGIEQAQIRGNTAVRQAETQGKYALDKQGLIEDTRRQGFGQLGQLFGGEADGRSRSMSIPGVGAMSMGAERPEAQMPAALQTNLMNARREFARSGSPQAKAGLDSAIANVINAAPVDDMMKQWAHTIATNPQLSAMPLEKIIQMHEAQNPDDALDMNEITQLKNLLAQALAGMNDPQ